MDNIVFIKKDRFTFPDNKKVIKADEYSIYLEANGIIERAREEANRIIEEAKQVYEAEKKRGYQDGIIAGKMEISEQMISTVSKTVNYFASIEEKVACTVITALKKILGTFDGNELVLKVVRNALSVVQNQQQVTLRVSEEQVEMVKTRINEILSEFPRISFIEVVPDSRLKSGDAILESDIGVVDARVDVQIEAIKKSLMKSFKSRD